MHKSYNMNITMIFFLLLYSTLIKREGIIFILIISKIYHDNSNI